jgi:hypothetical protein
MENTKCPDCGGELEQGTLMDYAYNKIFVQRYAQANIPSTNKTKFGIFETNFLNHRRVIAKRCIVCNRIFLYAQNFITDTEAMEKRANIIIILIIIVSVLIFSMLAIGLHWFQ